MPDQPSEPLGPEDLDQINNALSLLDNADRIIEKSIRAGLDMTKQRAESQERRRQLLQLKQAFFPGR